MEYNNLPVRGTQRGIGGHGARKHWTGISWQTSLSSHVTPCISNRTMSHVVTARCYAQRGVCCHKTSVRPSVCTSVRHTPAFCRNISSNFLSFSIPHNMAIFRRGLPNAASNAGSTKKYRDFRPRSRFISKMIQDRSIFIIADQYQIIYGPSNGAIFSDLERSRIHISKVTPFFDAEYFGNG